MSYIDCDAKIYNHEEAIRLSKIFNYPLQISSLSFDGTTEIVSNCFELIEYISKIEHISFMQPLLLILSNTLQTLKKESGV